MNSTKLFFVLCDANRNPRCDACKRKSGIQNGGSQTFINLYGDVATKFWQLNPCIQGPGFEWRYFFLLCNVSKNYKSKMAAHQMEILTSQPVYNVATQFQRKIPCYVFKGEELNESILHIVWCKLHRSEIYDGASQMFRVNFVLLTYLQTWVVPFLERHLRHLPSACITHDEKSLIEFLELDNMRIAVRILQLCCIQAEVYKLICKYLRFVIRHFRLLMSAWIIFEMGNHSAEDYNLKIHVWSCAAALYIQTVI